jgi:hypothetical protein
VRQPTSWTFRRGSRLRVAIAGADTDHYGQVPHGRPPQLRIHHGGDAASRYDGGSRAEAPVVDDGLLRRLDVRGGEYPAFDGKEVTAWLKEADSRTDAARRKDLYGKALGKIADQAYCVPIILYGRNDALNSALDYPVTPDELAHSISRNGNDAPRDDRSVVGARREVRWRQVRPDASWR